MNFKDFMKQKIIDTPVDEQTQESFDKMYNQYQNKSQNEIQNELLKMVAENKKNGKLSNTDLDNFYTNMSMMLDDEQRKNLKNLIKELKNDSN